MRIQGKRGNVAISPPASKNTHKKMATERAGLYFIFPARHSPKFLVCFVVSYFFYFFCI